MLSYSWAQQRVIFDVAARLRAAGIPIWLDIERMHGSINDRMAEAVDGAAVVLVALSAEYKLSANCRMEAEYANACRKPTIPIMAQVSCQPEIA